IQTLVPYIQVPDSRLALGLLSSHLLKHPSRGMRMLAVTGTSGKTTTTYLLESILKAAGYQVGVIGTVNFRFGDRVYPSTHTTPGAVELQKLLAEMKKDGCDAVVMEVSSHALKQQRVAGIAWDGMIFTNLTREHLDFHPDMNDYFESKAKLFREAFDFSKSVGKAPFAVVNIDDDYGKKLFEEFKANPKSATSSDFCFGTFSLQNNADFSGKGLKLDLQGIHGRSGDIKIESVLTAAYNIQNILGAVTLAWGLKIPNSAIEKGVTNLSNVPGRLEAVRNTQGIHVWVDYAHKSDALEKVLKTLYELKKTQSIITVFGCGGDRDREKRPIMGALALKWSDYVFVTSDNPRTEKPDAVIKEITAGMGSGRHFEVEPDRSKAIYKAIERAKSGDLVLIAGKGHEDYQIIADPSAPSGTRKIHFDDREVAQAALKKRELHLKSMS
ncbi:MAG: UDP-N-acetylmuramoyl-L-alanyl-D-glutamate--2,6-diaminopimelate ligase, partial [Bdellovibrionota bacterium]